MKKNKWARVRDAATAWRKASGLCDGVVFCTIDERAGVLVRGWEDANGPWVWPLGTVGVTGGGAVFERIFDAGRRKYAWYGRLSSSESGLEPEPVKLPNGDAWPIVTLYRELATVAREQIEPWHSVHYWIRFPASSLVAWRYPEIVKLPQQFSDVGSWRPGEVAVSPAGAVWAYLNSGWLCLG